MTKKSRSIEGVGVLGAMLGVAFVAAVIAVFFIVIARIGENQNMMYSRTSNNHYVDLYDKITVSENGEWFLFSPLKLRFPYSESVAFDNNFGARPKYHFSVVWRNPDTNEIAWQLGLSYLEDTSNYDKIHYAPVTLLQEPGKDYNIGDVYANVFLFDDRGNDAGEMKQLVSDIIALKDGRNIYILTYDSEDHISDQGEHIYKDLIDAVKLIELY